MSQFPDYYAILSIPKTATAEEIRTAYKRESLRTHPDRLATATPAEKQKATERFQVVADAYFVLSDPDRRKEYDAVYKSKKERTADPSASANFFTNFANMFGGKGPEPAQENAERPDADYMFADVFDDLLRPEIQNRAHWWAYLGAACGAGLGFIVANIPGLMVGAYAGNRLGAVRDAKGKAVAAVFAELGHEQKAEIIKALVVKLFGPSGIL